MHDMLSDAPAQSSECRDSLQRGCPAATEHQQHSGLACVHHGGPQALQLRNQLQQQLLHQALHQLRRAAEGADGWIRVSMLQVTGYALQRKPCGHQAAARHWHRRCTAQFNTRHPLPTCLRAGSYSRAPGEHTQRYRLRSSASAQLQGRVGIAGRGMPA